MTPRVRQQIVSVQTSGGVVNPQVCTKAIDVREMRVHVLALGMMYTGALIRGIGHRILNGLDCVVVGTDMHCHGPLQDWKRVQ